METQTKTAKIYYTVWGYTMTMVDYFEVVNETEKTVLLRRLESVEEPTGYLSGKATPGDKPFVDGDGEMVEIRAYKRTFPSGESYLLSRKDGVKMFIHPWDGQPHAYNHCD